MSVPPSPPAAGDVPAAGEEQPAVVAAAAVETMAAEEEQKAQEQPAPGGQEEAPAGSAGDTAASAEAPEAAAEQPQDAEAEESEESSSSDSSSSSPSPPGKGSPPPKPAASRTPLPRRRSRSRPGRGRGSAGGSAGGSSGGKGRGGGKAAGRGPPRRPCWHGRECARADCWFFHPDGRRMDEGRGADRRRAASSPERWAPSPRRRRRGSGSAGPQRRQRAASPAASSSSTSSRVPSPAPEAAASRGASPSSSSSSEEAPNFRDFVLQHCSEACPPEEALAKFKEHLGEREQRRAARAERAAARATAAAAREAVARRRRAEQSLSQVQASCVFFDIFHPLARLRGHDLRVRAAQLRALAFAEDRAAGRLRGLELVAGAAGGDEEQGPTQRLAGHLLPPHYAVDPDVDAVVLRDVQPTVSVWEVYDFLTQSEGFISIAWTEPRPGTLLRDVRARFASRGCAAAAAAEATKAGGLAAAVEVAAPAEKMLGFVVPPEMSHPDRIRKDVDLASRIARHLDALCDVQPAQAMAAIHGGAEELPDVERLDVLIVYLRRVHHFCFYGAAWCKDEWELRRRCGDMLVRDRVGGGELPPAAGDWAANHDRRLEAFLTSAALPRPELPSVDQPPIAEKSDALAEERTLRVSEGKFRCLECGKNFKGPEYVRKHIRKMHAHLIETIRQSAHTEVACAIYLDEAESQAAPVLEAVLS